MEVVDRIVTVVSWEPRFLLGLGRALERYEPSEVLAYYVKEYGGRTTSERCRLEALARKHGFALTMREIEYGAPSETWRTLREDLYRSAGSDGRVLLDFTTMPRDVLWTALFWLEASGTVVYYLYNQPESYGSGWLARDPDEPRLLYKLAGELEFGRPTALVAVTGFDLDRCRQAIEFFEPATVVVATQTGDQFENAHRNTALAVAAGETPLRRLEIDTYSPGHGYSVLQECVGALTADYNVVFCSFGPKPSAIALFRLQREHRQSALAFIGCRQYNEEYSEGLGEAVEGFLDWSCAS